MEIPQIIAHAEKLLAATWGQNVKLTAHAPLKSNHVVLRCDVEGTAPFTSVILKHVTFGDLTDKKQAWMHQRFLNECASLQFFTNLQQPFTARWLAGDVDAGLFIVEDLGNHPSVQDIAFGQDSQLAAQAAVAYASALGELQAATMGKEHEFTALQKSLGTARPFCDGNSDARTMLPSMHACFSALDVTPAAGFDEEVLAVGAAIHDEPLFRALCHCDAGLHNVMWLGDGQIRIVDFEFANYQHALTDILCARVGYPPSYHGRPLPHTLVTDMENAYRAALSQQIAAAHDDKLFYDAVVNACAQWALCELGIMWDYYLKARLEQGASYDEQDGRTLAGTATTRSRFLTYFCALIAAADEFDRLPACRATLSDVVDALHRHWSIIDPLPAYPALPL